MRFIVLASVLIISGLGGCTGTLRVGYVDPADPEYNRPGVVVRPLRIRTPEYHGPRYAVMTCTTESALRGQLNRVTDVQALTPRLERQIRDNQVSRLTGWGCNERIVRGYPSFQRVGSHTTTSGQLFGIYRVWQRDGNIRRAFDFGLTAR